MQISFKLNGKPVSLDAQPHELLSEVVRERLGLTGTHIGCDTSQCGACVLHVDGASVKSCTVLAVTLEGADITTIEGLAGNGALHPMQQAFHEHHGLQCGFCTPGMITTLIEFLRDNPDPTEQEVRIAISGNLCRCTGYQNIVTAALDAAKRLQAQAAPSA